jgi:hypothetical protein
LHFESGRRADRRGTQARRYVPRARQQPDARDHS